MNDYASSCATDFMQSYYKVARQKVVDDVSVLAIEACLINHLPTLFSPKTVWEIDDQTVNSVTAEEEKSSVERARCNKKQRVLENGLKELKRIQGYPSIHVKETEIYQGSPAGITTPESIELNSENESSKSETAHPATDLEAPASEDISAAKEALACEEPPAAEDEYSPLSFGNKKSKKKNGGRL
ncbi:hypothetical protein B0J11DRAFT_585763 [Dendryphion nanum]|uniref:GED domain-containing protein n=1 Tax=Dendryphion nanum TaxID=256645 RepID=A0A9P9D3A3_9PLEO|nr:hypothetical protein B0J11DRAFT_585763 [Dendryphion nanum]